jgi:hypothetical protein
MIHRREDSEENAGGPAVLVVVQDDSAPEEGLALLRLPAPDGTLVEVPLPVGKAMLLLALVRFWEADEGLPEALRGWRPRSVVAAAHQALLENPYRILDTTVTRYLGLMTRKVAAAFVARDLDPPARLTEGCRATGIRIRPGALIVVWRRGRPEPDRPPDDPRFTRSDPTQRTAPLGLTAGKTWLSSE